MFLGWAHVHTAHKALFGCRCECWELPVPPRADHPSAVWLATHGLCHATVGTIFSIICLGNRSSFKNKLVNLPFCILLVFKDGLR